MTGETESNCRLPSCGFIVAIIAPLLLSFGASTMKVPEQSLPEPIVDPLRLSIGVYYNEARSDVEYVGKNTGLTDTP